MGLPLLKAQIHRLRPVAVTPYTVRLQERIENKHSGGESYANHLFAVRSDGSRVHITAPPGDEAGQRAFRTVELADGRRSVIHDNREVKSTTRLAASTYPARWHRDPAENCAVGLAGNRLHGRPEWSEGEEAIDGIRTIRISSGDSTFWFAPDFGCALVRSRTEFSDIRSEKTLVGLIRGEPDAVLFGVPASYREVTPSRINASLSGRQEGESESDPIRDEGLRRMDEQYQKHRLRADR